MNTTKVTGTVNITSGDASYKRTRYNEQRLTKVAKWTNFSDIMHDTGCKRSLSTRKPQIS